MRDGDMEQPKHSKFLPCLSLKHKSVHWHVLDEESIVAESDISDV